MSACLVLSIIEEYRNTILWLAYLGGKRGKRCQGKRLRKQPWGLVPCAQLSRLVITLSLVMSFSAEHTYDLVRVSFNCRLDAA